MLACDMVSSADRFAIIVKLEKKKKNGANRIERVTSDDVKVS
jgi:hypothetical protein